MSASRTAAHPRPTTAALFSPFCLGRLELPNRIVMAPLTRARADQHGVPIRTRGRVLRPARRGGPDHHRGHGGVPAGDRLRQLAWPVHRRPGNRLAEDHRMRSMRPEDASSSSSSTRAGCPTRCSTRASCPSARRRSLAARPPSGTTACTSSPGPGRCGPPSSPALPRQFGAAAERALAAGFDGVEVHAGNGYLLDQFLRDGANHRDDDYGGTARNRARLLREVTAAVISIWGNKRVGVRISPLSPTNGMTDSDPVATFTQAARDLADPRRWLPARHRARRQRHPVSPGQRPVTPAGQRVLPANVPRRDHRRRRPHRWKPEPPASSTTRPT